MTSLFKVLSGQLYSEQCQPIMEEFLRCVGNQQPGTLNQCEPPFLALRECLTQHHPRGSVLQELKERLVVDPDEIPRKKTGLGWGLHRVAPHVFSDEETGEPEKSEMGPKIAQEAPRFLDTDNVPRSETRLKKWLRNHGGRMFEESEEEDDD